MLAKQEREDPSVLSVCDHRANWSRPKAFKGLLWLGLGKGVFLFAFDKGLAADPRLALSSRPHLSLPSVGITMLSAASGHSSPGKQMIQNRTWLHIPW